jgi:hypothetical protein
VWNVDGTNFFVTRECAQEAKGEMTAEVSPFNQLKFRHQPINIYE